MDQEGMVHQKRRKHFKESLDDQNPQKIFHNKWSAHNYRGHIWYFLARNLVQLEKNIML